MSNNEITLVAILDDRNVFQGIERLPLADLTAEHAHLPDGCDLSPGSMRWDFQLQTFLPVSPEDLVGKDVDSGALTAIALGFLAVKDFAPLPDETLAWMKAHFTAYDFVLGAPSNASRAKVKAFLAGA